MSLTTVVAQVTPTLKKQFKAKCKANGLKQKEVITNFIGGYLAGDIKIKTKTTAKTRKTMGATKA